MKIADYLLQVLQRSGLTTVFGNPGTTEIPLVSACERTAGMRYVVALSEIAAVSMADGYARAKRRPAVVNLHVAPGLGNGTGALYTAGIAGTPLLVLVGGQDRRLLHTEPVLWGPLEAMAAPVCKSVHTLATPHDAAATLRRAVREVLTPPYRPVAVVCPPDLLVEDAAEDPVAVTAPLPGTLSAADAGRYARWLSKARRCAIVVTEEAYWSRAAARVEALAQRLGAPIFAAPYTGVLPVGTGSVHFAGYLSPSYAQIAQRLAGHDALLLLGGRGFRTTLYSEAPIASRTAWIGLETDRPAFAAEPELACTAEIEGALRAILDVLPRGAVKANGVQPPTRLRMPVAAETLHPTRAVRALLRRYRRAVWVDESGLSTSDVRALMKCSAGDYFINGSGGIGWGVPAAVGIALARPERQVVAVAGDGSALYASEALWTAAHHGAKMLLVVLNNRRYATLNAAACRLAGSGLRSFTIEPPAMDFAGLARLYGWRHASAATERELERVLARLGATLSANTILELKLDPGLTPLAASRHF